MQESLPWIMGFGGVIADEDGNFMARLLQIDVKF